MYATLNEQVFLGLSPENQMKVESIYTIAELVKRYSLPPITPKFFDNLYDLSLEQLAQFYINAEYRYSIGG